MTLFHSYECSNGDGTGIAGNVKRLGEGWE
jgi:hypothetical protein